MNMCRGIAKYSGSSSQTITLERADEQTRDKNRNNMCPPGTCAKAVAEYVKDFYPNGIPPEAEQALLVAGDLQCDEFPFATSVQGGDQSTGVVWCLPGTENSWQGGTMSKYFKEFTSANRKNGKFIGVGHSFVVKIVGWNCQTQMPDPSIKRRELPLLERRDAFAQPGVNFTGG